MNTTKRPRWDYIQERARDPNLMYSPPKDAKRPRPDHYFAGIILSHDIIDKQHALLASSHVYDDGPMPQTYKQAMQSVDKDKWEAAIQDELKSLKQLKVWTVVPRPTNHKVIGSRWIFVLKRNLEGSVIKHKARFPYIQDNIYVELPDGNSDKKSGVVGNLNQALYRTKQAPLCWYQHISNVLLNYGYDNIVSDECIFHKTCNQEQIIFGLYVDNIIVIASRPALTSVFKEILQTSFKIKDISDSKKLLGIAVTQVQDRIYLSRERFIMDTIKYFNVEIIIQNSKGINFYSPQL